MAFPKLTLEAGILVQLHDRHAAGETASAADFTPLLRHDLAGAELGGCCCGDPGGPGCEGLQRGPRVLLRRGLAGALLAK